MKNKNIHFVGYILEKEDKKSFIDLFECKKKFFLEASKKALSYRDENSQYFPEILYKSYHKKSYTDLNKTVKVTSTIRKMYQHDLRHFKGALPKKIKLNKIKIFALLFLYTVKQIKSKSSKRLNLFNFASLYYKNIKQYKSGDTVLTSRLIYFLFRLKFISGYLYAKKILNEKPKAENNIYVMWGKSYSSRILLLSYLVENKIPYLVAEYGEIPGTISLSPYGIFGEIFSVDSWEALNKKPITDEDLSYTRKILNTIKERQISTRSYDSNMYFLMKYFYDNTVKIENRKKVVYVNGAELFSSDLYFGRWNINNKARNPNKMLLEDVVEFFKDKDYMILYKEHPMAVKQSKNALLNPSDFPTVNFIKDMNIHDILDLADMVVTFPSKVVITSLLYHKETYVVGDFTIPYSVPKIKYYTQKKLKDMPQDSLDNKQCDYDLFVMFMAKFLKYSLIVMDETLHTKLNRKEEQEKIKEAISLSLSRYKDDK